MVNCRFTVSIHVLCLLASQQKKSLTSEYIAGSVNTNPVVIRRILAVLRKAGFVRSQPGAKGGWVLVGKPSGISLGRVYQVTRPGPVFEMHRRAPNPHCPVGSSIQRGLGTYYRDAQSAMEAELGRSTIADVLDDILTPAR